MKKYLIFIFLAAVSICACDTLGNLDDRMEEIAGEYVMSSAYDYNPDIIAAFPPATISREGDVWMFECTMPSSYEPLCSFEHISIESVRTGIAWNEAAGEYLFVKSPSLDDYYYFVINAEKNMVTYGSIVWKKK